MAKLLDLVALGTVADVVALDDNNRILVEQGLKRIQARLLGIAVSAGILAENLMTMSGLYSAAPWPFPAPFAPLWLPAMWVNFATTVNVSLRGIAPYPLVAALLGAPAGPLAYYSGDALGAVRFGIPAWRGLAALAILWGAAIPGFFALARRLAQASRRPNR